MRALRASDVAPQPMTLLWRSRIPAATLTVIAGKPGLGKSTLGSLIAAELSNMGLATILSDLEDDHAAVVRPRLEVAGANLDLVHLIPPNDAPTLPRDYDALQQMVEETHASLLILDPVAAHFSSEHRVHQRSTLRRLLEIARSTRCAILAMHHTTKSGGDPLERIGGRTGGLAGTARAAYIYGHDPTDQDRRALACVKINGLDEPATLVISHETVEFDADGLTLEAGQLRIRGEISTDTKLVLRRGRRHEERDAACAEWLTKFLAEGGDCQRPTREIRTELEGTGFGWQTLLRAATELRVEKIKAGYGRGGFWSWRLPDEHPVREAVGGSG